LSNLNKDLKNISELRR